MRGYTSFAVIWLWPGWLIENLMKLSLRLAWLRGGQHLVYVDGRVDTRES